MSWRSSYRRTPTRVDIVVALILGFATLTLAVLDATRYSEQTATHGDYLLTVGLAVVGGLSLGLALGDIRHRAAMRQALAAASLIPG